MTQRTIIEKVLEILENHPLCDNCLGRLFGGLGRGLANEERGKALKILALMEIHRRLIEDWENTREKALKILENIGDFAKPLYQQYFLKELAPKTCSICGERNLNNLIEKYAKESVEVLRTLDARTFIVGVKKGSSVEAREEEIIRKYDLKYYESIRNEIKREVGKKIQQLANIPVDFTKPDIVLLIDLENNKVDPIIMPLYIKGRYWKKGRMISQSIWILWNGKKKYPLSIEETLQEIAKILQGERAILHASGREDVDARMLGTGRPMIVEVVKPKRRRVSLKELEDAVNKVSPYVEVKLEGEAERKDVRLIKMEKAKTTKVYKALIIVDKELEENDLRKIEEFFKDKTVLQQTPRRVLHRRPNATRQKKVYSVKTRRITKSVFEALIRCEGGLYVKELVSGDQGRTKPSFSDILEASAKCIELDVVSVQL